MLPPRDDLLGCPGPAGEVLTCRVAGRGGREEWLLEIRVASTILYCARWRETVAFYRSVLGLPVSHETDWFVEFALGPAARLSVADERRASIGSAGGRGVTISLRVAEVASVWAELAAAGLEPTELRELWGGRVTYIRDPEGHRVEVWS
jgi:catechol 2,3-dioxygenase-like lactoylglutathione lyase family enzyme